MSPFELMFGRKPRFSIDVVREEQARGGSAEQYIQDLSEAMETTRIV